MQTFHIYSDRLKTKLDIWVTFSWFVANLKSISGKMFSFSLDSKIFLENGKIMWAQIFRSCPCLSLLGAPDHKAIFQVQIRHFPGKLGHYALCSILALPSQPRWQHKGDSRINHCWEPVLLYLDQFKVETESLGKLIYGIGLRHRKLNSQNAAASDGMCRSIASKALTSLTTTLTTTTTTTITTTTTPASTSSVKRDKMKFFFVFFQSGNFFATTKIFNQRFWNSGSNPGSINFWPTDRIIFYLGAAKFFSH